MPSSSNRRRRAASAVASPGRGWPQAEFVHSPPEWYLLSARRCSSSSPRSLKAKTENARCSSPERCTASFSPTPKSASASSIRTTFSIIGPETVSDAAMIFGDDRASPGTQGRGGRDAHPRADGAQPEARPLSRGGELQHRAEGPLACPAGDRRAHGHERPLVGAP